MPQHDAIPGYTAGSWVLDPVRGHFGKFDVQVVTAGNPLESSVAVSVDTASADTASVDTASADAASVDTGNEARDEDLRSERFLDAATHPLITFRSTGVTAAGDGTYAVLREPE